MTMPTDTSTDTDHRGAIESSATVRTMFDRIVPRYDLMNHVMTGGMDIRWRSMVSRQASTIDSKRSENVLDVATGTGDVAFAISKAGVTNVIGLDFAPEMIAAAKAKGIEKNSAVTFQVGDAMHLPFADGTFDACTVSFGLRNMPDYGAAIKEMARILRPGGRFICLEMTPFKRPLLGPPFHFYFEQIVPVVGGVISGDAEAYKYLPQSVAAFPPAHELAELIKAAGLANVTYQLLGFGTVAIHSGTRGSSEDGGMGGFSAIS